MIRSRDLLLFVVVIGFLFLGISWSVSGDLKERTKEERVENQPRIGDDALTHEYRASVSGFEDVDRVENIRRLREKLAQNTSYQTPETDQIVENEVKVTTSEGGGARETPLLCEEYVSQPLYASGWNTSRMSLTFIEGARVVMEDVETVTGSGTSTVILSTSIPRIQLPSFRERGIEPFCIPDSVIGVSPDGGLMFNSDVVKYQNRGSDEMIGYARDGFPIYGTSDDPAVLDECGGLLDGGTYRYHLRANSPFILGCFGAPPARILE